jgi:molybdopterin/thiamine biosynthesis adenylyltransferase
MFSFQQGLSGEAVGLIVDGCQRLKKLSLHGVKDILDDDVIHVINVLGKQLIGLSLDGRKLTDVAYSYLRHCAR